MAALKEEEEKTDTVKTNPVPLYNTPERLNYRPSKPQDFGDGGALPEIHYSQYPLDMGRNVTVDDRGNLTFDAIVKQNENAKKIVYSQHRDLIPKILKDDEEIEKTTLQIKEALEKIVNVRLSAAQPKNVQTQSQDSKFIKYKPSQQSAAFNSGAKERIIRMVEMPVDSLEPPKFNGSPPVPVMHSPPRPVTVKDQQDWKIPPCISNWKNPKGYTIPLDKRLVADGRGVQEVQINDTFAKLSEALYVAKQQAREAVSMRSKVQKEMMMKEKERKEQELRALAQKARSERTGTGTTVGTGLGSGSGSFAHDASMMDTDEPTRPEYEQRNKRGSDRDRDQPRESKEEREERIQREKVREERRKERERERKKRTRITSIGSKSPI